MNKLKLFIKGFFGRDQFEIFAFADTKYNQGRKLREKTSWMKNTIIWYLNFPFRYARAFSLAFSSNLHGKGFQCLIYAFKSSNHFKGWK